ncbi:hypothetical protein M23134_02506 [Microscilla marina ATCC 23134]|uniref:Uncharacterized protein n=1 Tax=Microscilla marina ATCC 23134 TaxID=313606 RepID=A1ZTS2_MICM2|nr:hypothetical protein M23134_02506 [Microscilla marina ATCC 23134]
MYRGQVIIDKLNDKVCLILFWQFINYKKKRLKQDIVNKNYL